MSFSLDNRELSVTVAEDARPASELRHESDSTHRHQHSLSIYNPAIAPTAHGTAENSENGGLTPHDRDEKDDAGSSTQSNTPVQHPDSTHATAPPFLSSIMATRPLPSPPQPMEVHSPSKGGKTSSPTKAFPPSSSSVFPNFSSPMPSTPLTRARLQEHRVAELDKVQQAQGRWMLAGAVAIGLVVLLAIIAFVGGVYYLDHRNDSNLTPASVGATQLADGAVTSTKIALGAVGLTAFSAPLQALVVGMNVTYEQAIGLLPTAGAGLLQNATSHTLSVAVDQRLLSINGQNQLTVGASAITAQYIAAAAVTAAQVASAAVTTAAIANAAVTTVALGPDVLSELAAINSTAQAAWLSRPVTGSGITVQNGRVSVDYNTTAFTITSANALTIAPHSISSAQVQPYSIPLSALAVDFLSLIPTPGVGIALVNESFNLVYNHSSFTVNNDALTLLPASVTSAHIAPGAVTMAALGTDVAATLSGIGSTATTAYDNTAALLLTQSFLQQQLLTALNISDAALLASVANASTALYQAMIAVNASTYSALSSVNYTSFQFLLALQDDMAMLTSELTTIANNLTAQLPLAGVGLMDTANVFSVVADPTVFAFEATAQGAALTLQPSSITSQYLANGSVTASAVAAGAIGGDQIADEAVTLSKLTPALQAVMTALNVGEAVSTDAIVVGGGDTSIITRPAGGNLIIEGVTNGSVALQSAAGNQVAVNDSGVAVSASALTFAAGGAVSILANGTVSAAASDVLMTAPGASLELSSTGVVMTGSQVTVGGGSVVLSSPSTVSFTGTAMSVNGSVMFTPTALAVTGAEVGLDFTALPSTIVRLTGTVATTNVTFIGCSDSSAGTPVTLYNQLRSGTVRLPAGTCGNAYYDIVLQPQQRVTVTCAGLVHGLGALDCLRSELAQGGYMLPTSAGTISNNILNGVVYSVTAKGTVTLSFTPATNVATVSFVISNPLLAQPGAAGAVMLTPMLSGSVNPQYADSKQSPLWVCVKQSLTGTQLNVTVVNVGDALYAGQQQTIQFMYQLM